MALYLGKDLISGGGSGGSVAAIIDVDTLPTENINGNAFYRVKSEDAYTFVNGVKNNIDGIEIIIHTVSVLPETGEPFLNEAQTIMNIYLQTSDSVVYGYGGDIGFNPITDAGIAYILVSTEAEATEADTLYIVYDAGGLFAYNGTEWVEYVTKAQLDEAKLDPTNLNGWCLEPGKISATDWDENEHKLSISSQGIEINRQGNVDKLQFPGTNGTSVALATEKDIERIDANGEEIANYCLGLNTRLETVETFINSLINATEVAL